MASAEGGSVPNGWGIQPTRGSGERHERILPYFEGRRMLLFVSI